jgi:hypothetical protein
MPTPEQFMETAKRLRVAIEYDVRGMLVGDNDVARAVMACEAAAERTPETAKRVAFGILTRHPDCLQDDVSLNDLIDDIANAILGIHG